MVSASPVPPTVTKPPDTLPSVNADDPKAVANSNTYSSNPPTNTPASSQQKHPQPTDVIEHLQRLFHHFTLAWEKVVIIILGILSLHNLWSATKFILIDYPALQKDLTDQAVTDLRVRLVLTDSIALMLTTLISIIFAIRISKGQERISRYLELVFGTLIIIFYQNILKFLGNLDYTQISSSIRNFLTSL